MKKPPQRNDVEHNYNLGGPPEWVVVTWVNEQLRDKIQRQGPALADICGMQKDTPEPPPEALLDREAEP